MTITSIIPETDDLDFDPPEGVTIHKVPTDLELALEWGLLPGVALCGFVFTTDNQLGSPSGLYGDPRFVMKRCEPCVDRLHHMTTETEAAPH